MMVESREGEVKSLHPNDVFTPGKLPIRPGNVYASRGEAEKDFNKALSRGLVPLVYGEYGVGKTSMARYSVRGDDERGKLVNIESAADKTMRDIFSRCLEKIGYTIQMKRTTGSSEAASVEESGGAEASITGIKSLIAYKRGKTATATEQQEEQLVVTSPTDSKIIEICETEGLILIIDEVHRSTSNFLDELAKFLKAYGNANCRRFRIVLLGTSSDATRLVRRDPGIDRLIQEVPLQAMSEEEARYVVLTGMNALGIRFYSGGVDKLIKSSVGSPNILQYLCLETAEAAHARAPKMATEGDVAHALSEYIERKEARLYGMYKKGIETVGPVKYRKQILRAVAEAEDEYVTMEEIRSRVSVYRGKEVPSSSLSGPLRELKDTRFGPLLSDVDRPGGDGRVMNYSTFVDASLKAFIRMQVMREEDAKEK
ncbi:AAA family ATPase [Tundrisphaera sp. TA3]|uniref:AAA family ATPase n=1 Tax=Tundrisphaera sp. TA3 TaxID=3435775 RepID=UPI003EC10280